LRDLGPVYVETNGSKFVIIDASPNSTNPISRRTTMNRIALSSIVLVVLFIMPGAAPAAETVGIDALTAKDSPLAKGEVIAFFGDSITQGGARPGGYCRLIGEAIEKQRPELGVKIVYAGISGHKVPDLQGRLDRDVLSKKPTIVFIYIGINDVWHSTRGRGTSKELFDGGLRDLITKISAADAKVVLCTPSTIGEKTDGSNPLDSMLEEYSAISRKVAADTGVTLCDLRKEFLDHLKKHNPDNKERGILTGDGVHLNAAGNAFVAAQAAEAIARTLKKDAPATSDSKTKSLFNGTNLSGWHVDIPHLDKNPDANGAFIVRDGKLVSLGNPKGHLITDAIYENYRIEVEYRFAGKPGNCGVLVHASTPRALYKMFPKSIEVQMNHRHAGDFWCIVEDITVPDMVTRRGPKEKWGVTEGKARRILNLTDDSERPVGEWNTMVIECVADAVKVWVNGDLVNHGTKCTAARGQVALQAEGSEVEFCKLSLTPIAKLTD
jgi:lysophospholipase L1-like esterase